MFTLFTFDLLSNGRKLANDLIIVFGKSFLNPLCFLVTDLLQYFRKCSLWLTFMETMIGLSIFSNSHKPTSFLAFGFWALNLSKKVCEISRRSSSFKQKKYHQNQFFSLLLADRTRLVTNDQNLLGATVRIGMK